jgi:hypothetical protein
LLTALDHANERSAEDKARIATLEARLARLEESADVSATPRPSVDQRILERMDRLIDFSQRVLLSERFLPPQLEAAPTRESAPAQATRCGDAADDPREELRRLVERMYGGSSGFRGGLSVEQSEALKLLLRPERSLDTHNPWY